LQLSFLTVQPQGNYFFTIPAHLTPESQGEKGRRGEGEGRRKGEKGEGKGRRGEENEN
jgi:hypothetical protein